MPQRPNFSSLNISSQLIGISQEVEHDFLQKRTLGENSDKWELRKRRNLPHLHCLCSLRRIFILLYLGSKLDQPAPTKKENPEVFQMPAEYTSLADSDLACSHRHGADPDVQLGSARSLHRGFRWVQSKCKRLCTFPVPVHTSCVHRGRTAWCGRNCCFSCTWQTLRKGKKWLEERFAYRGQYGAQQWGPCTKQLIVLWGGTRARRRFRTDLIFVGRECWRCSSMPTNCDWKLGQETVFVCVCVCVWGGVCGRGHGLLMQEFCFHTCCSEREVLTHIKWCQQTTQGTPMSTLWFLPLIFFAAAIKNCMTRHVCHISIWKRDCNLKATVWQFPIKWSLQVKIGLKWFASGQWIDICWKQRQIIRILELRTTASRAHPNGHRFEQNVTGKARPQAFQGKESGNFQYKRGTVHWTFHGHTTELGRSLWVVGRFGKHET